MAIASAASAQESQRKPSPPSVGGEQFTSHLVKTGLYLIAGGGANSLLRLSANGSILVDGKCPGTYRALMSQVRRISKLSDLPLRVLTVTDHHDNHTGNNAQFLAAGVPIIVQENAARRLPPDGPDAKAGARTVTYDREYTLKLGGVEVQLKHFGSARTSGDAVVYFPNLRVVAVGDLFTPGSPEPDFSAGGSLVNWGSVLGRILELDFDVVVPSTGPMVTRADLEAFKTRIDAVASRARSLARNGVAKDRLMTELKTDDLGWNLSFTGDALDRFYAEVSQAK